MGYFKLLLGVCKLCGILLKNLLEQSRLGEARFPWHSTVTAVNEGFLILTSPPEERKDEIRKGRVRKETKLR